MAEPLRDLVVSLSLNTENFTRNIRSVNKQIQEAESYFKLAAAGLDNGDYLWQPSLTVGAPDMLLGRPVYTSAYMPTIGAGAKTILFGDLGYYWVADREGRSFKRLNELYAATGQVGFLASERVDGKLILPEAVKVLAQKSA